MSEWSAYSTQSGWATSGAKNSSASPARASGGVRRLSTATLLPSGNFARIAWVAAQRRATPTSRERQRPALLIRRRVGYNPPSPRRATPEATPMTAPTDYSSYRGLPTLAGLATLADAARPGLSVED